MESVDTAPECTVDGFCVTVCGPIRPNEIGAASMLEHTLCSLSSLLDEGPAGLKSASISLENLTEVRRFPTAWYSATLLPHRITTVMYAACTI